MKRERFERTIAVRLTAREWETLEDYCASRSTSKSELLRAFIARLDARLNVSQPAASKPITSRAITPNSDDFWGA